MSGQEFWELGQVTDDHLLEGVSRLIRTDRGVSARLLAHLAEVEERRLHLKQAKSSMFEYCVDLGMSEDEAGRRVCAARVARRFPEVYRMLDEGKLCLSVICKLKHYLTEANSAELFAGVAGMSYRKGELWLAGRFPRPDAPSLIRRLPDSQLPEKAVATPPSSDDRTRFEPLSADRYRVQFTAGRELKEKLDLVADLMTHRNPSRDLARIVERALDLLIAQLKKERFAQTDRPQPTGPAKYDTVTSATRRAVFERDGLRCAFVDERGRRCTGRAFLERDHRRPKGKGGGPGADNVRHLCRAHNQWLAELEYGRQHVDRARDSRRRHAARRREQRGKSAANGARAPP